MPSTPNHWRISAASPARTGDAGSTVLRGFLSRRLTAAILAVLLAMTAAAAAPPSAGAADSEPAAVGQDRWGREHRNVTVRFATFNVSLFRDTEGQLVEDLRSPEADTVNVEQIRNVAEIIQRERPDVLLVNEFDYTQLGTAVDLFQRNFLTWSQNGATPIHYPHRMAFPSNTGVPTGFDLNNDGVVGEEGRPYGDDSFGFGTFPGQYAFAVLSRHPIVEDEIRSFQFFHWEDMPGALLPDDPETPEPADWYSEDELDIFRLSSKNHVDVPIRIGREIVHVLASHPTPPAFEGPEMRNTLRNHDEIRFWADYIDPRRSDYIYDDDGLYGGLERGARFVVAGDLNADPFDSGLPGAIEQLLDHRLVRERPIPDSEGAVEAARRQGGANDEHRGNPAHDTADFSDGSVGNLRVDYVLPRRGMRVRNAEVFWPEMGDPLFRLIGTFDPDLPNGFPASDHRLVRIDVRLPFGKQFR